MKSPLEEKIWFRILKVIFVFSYIIVIFIGITGSFVEATKNVLTEESYQLVGEQARKMFDSTADDHLSSAEVGRRVHENDELWIEVFRTLPYDAIEYTTKFVPEEFALYLCIVFLATSFVFWLMRGIFYYVTLGAFAWWWPRVGESLTPSAHT